MFFFVHGQVYGCQVLIDSIYTFDMVAQKVYDGQRG